ncbi:uncharacterized protein N7515_003690 [Penicillium bovifimosum]|uniref:Uncharacterized protein n=1 Tax=Penicillium bovifimosum TaxID=126998 RepID=A0A9W9H551_9EURO|nr:uncharacterized protein N7515_003690 [Penicillium bovifimosum]KAJ5138842.1 hypothetical protein N7515_003690 [Penicillium bovifimosum]
MQKQKHTTVWIRWWSPTQLLTHRRVAYVRPVVGWVSPGMSLDRTLASETLSILAPAHSHN